MLLYCCREEKDRIAKRAELLLKEEGNGTSFADFVMTALEDLRFALPHGEIN